MTRAPLLLVISLATTLHANPPATHPAQQAHNTRLERLLNELATAQARLDALRPAPADPFALQPSELSPRLTPTTRRASGFVEDWSTNLCNGHTVYNRPALFHQTPTIVRDAGTGTQWIHLDRPRQNLIDDRTKQKQNLP